MELNYTGDGDGEYHICLINIIVYAMVMRSLVKRTKLMYVNLRGL